MIRLVFLALVLLSTNALAHECCVPLPKPKVKTVVKTVPVPAPIKQEQEQAQSVVVNVQAPASTTTHLKVVEKRVEVAAKPNRLGLLFGYAEGDCCSKGRIIGGASYSRVVAGPLSLGVGALTNRSYFGIVGLDF